MFGKIKNAISSGSDMMAKAKQLKEGMAKMEQALKGIEVEMSSGSGLVNVKVSGKKEILSIKLNEDMMKESKASKVEEHIVSAINRALYAADKEAEKEMQKLAGDFNIPGLM